MESLILQDFIIEYQAYTGGFNGITDYSNYAGPYFLWFILTLTVAFFVLARALTHSRVGTVLKSIRDNFVHAEWITLHDNPNFRGFVDFLRTELDRVGPAHADLCRDFFSRAVALELSFFEAAYTT